MIAYRTKTEKVIEPLPHQERILQDLKILNKALVHIPSGAGKTHTAAFDVRNKKPKTFMYISHRNEINTQAIKIFKEVCGIEDPDIGVINQTSKQFDKPFLFANIQTVSSKRHIHKLRKDIDYIVIDEFHHAAAKTYRKIMKYLQPKTLLGLTATPDRMDAQDVRQLLDNNVVGNIDIMDGIKHKILIPFHYRGYKDNVDYSDIKWNGHRYKENDLDKKLLIPERDKKVIEHYKEIIEPDKRQTIGFCATIKHVKRMVDVFKKAGINAEGITYYDTIEKRRKIIEKFRKGEINVLFSRDILNEGVDFPECEALMFLRPTISETIFLQQLGRGLRKRRGKKPVIVLDFISNYHNAYKIKAYLSKIVKKKPKIIEKGKNFKPVYNMSVPIYEFESEVIEMMELQEIMAKRKLIYANEVTEEKLIQNYHDVKERLGRIPKSEEMDNIQISPITLYHYRVKWGSWNGFLKSIGEHISKPYNLHTKDIKSLKDLKKLYFKVKKVKGLGKNDFLSQREWIEATGYDNYRQLEKEGLKGWYPFLKKIGERTTLECTYCKKRFPVKQKRVKFVNGHFCSGRCADRYDRVRDKKNIMDGRYEYNCSFCLEKFRTHFSYKENRNRYCSDKCVKKARYYNNRQKILQQHRESRDRRIQRMKQQQQQQQQRKGKNTNG